MKGALKESIIDYIKFSYEFEGVEFPEMAESIFEEILEEDLAANDAVASFIEGNKLTAPYEAKYDEMGRYPESRCLVNYFNIRDRKDLRMIDMFISSVRLCDMLVHPMEISLSFTYLQEIHHNMFADIYPSAGMLRSRSVSKRTEFCRPEYLERQANEVFDKLRSLRYLKDCEDTDDFINELAYFMGEMEALHPFNDGNGRTSRFFFNMLAWNAGYDIIFHAVDPDRFLEANIAAIDGDYQPLVDVLEEIVIRKNED